MSNNYGYRKVTVQEYQRIMDSQHHWMHQDKKYQEILEEDRKLWKQMQNAKSESERQEIQRKMDENKEKKKPYIKFHILREW